MMVRRTRRRAPVDYDRLCTQTATIYHASLDNGFKCTRTVVRGAFFSSATTQTVDKTGGTSSNASKVILPSGWGGRRVWMQDDADTGFAVHPGDKVYMGVGPEITDRAAWAGYVPARVPGLMVVQHVQVYHWDGAVCHVEVE